MAAVFAVNERNETAWGSFVCRSGRLRRREASRDMDATTAIVSTGHETVPDLARPSGVQSSSSLLRSSPSVHDAGRSFNRQPRPPTPTTFHGSTSHHHALPGCTLAPTQQPSEP